MASDNIQQIDSLINIDKKKTSESREDQQSSIKQKEGVEGLLQFAVSALATSDATIDLHRDQRVKKEIDD